MKSIPETLFELGYTDLVSVIPPGAKLVPSSTIPQGALGKIPGIQHENGLWSGYGWQKFQASEDDVRRWVNAGANIGMRADSFPAVDIDCTDETLAQVVEDFARSKLGDAPRRIGLPPKRLLVYRSVEPFGRMRLVFEKAGVQHLVEVLGHGQQYLVHGIHPKTQRAYEWTDPLTDRAPRMLKPITVDRARAFLRELKDVLESLDCIKIVISGTGAVSGASAAASQPALEAPNLELLAQAVKKIPNTNALFPDRDDYVKMGCAIRAAGGDNEDAFLIFADWASRWEGNTRSPNNDPENVRSDWRRMRPPFRVGWSWIVERARPFGFETATSDFDVIQQDIQEANREPEVLAVPYSDDWLVERIVERRGAEVRYVASRGQFLVWKGHMWQPDAITEAEWIVSQELRVIGSHLARQGATVREIQANEKKAITICSAARARAVLQLLKVHGAISVGVGSLDHDSWVLNTPGGLVDLKEGSIGPPKPDALCTRSTAVPPDFSATARRWLQFLSETTNGDRELIGYLQRLCGYALTGSTREQQLSFIFGPGANGKSVFLNVLSGVLGDYAAVAAMDTFTSSYSDKHTTDIASLLGARLVTASETDAGKRWDEARLKSLTGGEIVKARFMRQDNFTFLPQFKLVFVGNHQPALHNTDAAIRRRIHMVPFVHTPPEIDRELGSKLRGEWPAILAWMIEGCKLWQKEGLNPPAVVQASTEEYMEGEDAVGRWIEECCDLTPDATALTSDLYLSWREWANGNGEHVGKLLRLAKNLVGRRLERWEHPATRRHGFKGISLRNRIDEDLT